MGNSGKKIGLILFLTAAMCMASACAGGSQATGPGGADLSGNPENLPGDGIDRGTVFSGADDTV